MIVIFFSFSLCLTLLFLCIPLSLYFFFLSPCLFFPLYLFLKKVKYLNIKGKIFLNWMSVQYFIFISTGYLEHSLLRMWI